MIKINPATIYILNCVVAFNTKNIPNAKKRRKRMISVKTPTNPNSSPITPKIKSVFASGINYCFLSLFPNPTPATPPRPIAIWAAIC